MENLIYNTLEPRKWQIENFSKNVESSFKLIKNYPQLSSAELHSIEKLEILAHQKEAVIYKFDNTVLKYITESYLGKEETKKSKEAFFREIIIGLELNKLDSDNFVRTLGYYNSEKKCSIPHVKNTKDCTYLYIKEVQGPTLKKFIKTCSLAQFKDIMIKLIKSYEKAQERFDFCHYDFHTSNVIISSKGEDLIPVIIDFGASHIKLKSNIGELWPEEGRYDGVSLWVYDIFKIFAFSWEETFYTSCLDRINAEYNIEVELMDSTLDNFREYTDETWRFRKIYNSEKDDYDEIDETIGDFFIRLEEGNAKIDADITLEQMKNILPDALKKKTADMKTLEENRNTIGQINRYCLKLLRYFHKDISSDWLEEYSKKVSPTWGSSVTKSGYEADLKDFIRYMEFI